MNIQEKRKHIRERNGIYTAYDNDGKVIIVSKNPKVISSMLWSRCRILYEWDGGVTETRDILLTQS